jgi:hypothetical protein
MKKQIILVTLVFCTFQLLAQKNATQLRNSFYNHTYKTWELKTIADLSYFENNDSIVQLVSNVDIDGNQLAVRRYIRTFNLDGEIVSSLLQNGNSVAGYYNFTKQTYDYSSVIIKGEPKSYLSAYVHYTWNNGESAWDTGSYEYSTVNNTIGKINETIKILDLSSNVRTRLLNTYNTTGELASVEFHYSDGPNWVKSYKTFYSYTANEQTEEKFDYDNDSDSFNILTAKYVSIFDVDDRLLERVHYGWRTNSNSYTPVYRRKYDYDDEGDIIEEVSGIYNQLENMWEPDGDKTEYSYTELNSILSNSNLQVRVYPNPSSDYIHLDLIGVKSISVYSIAGQLVKALDESILLSETSRISCSDLINGTYILNVVSKDNEVRRARFTVRH